MIDAFGRFMAVFFKKVLNQQGDVFFSFSQRREMDGDNVDSIEWLIDDTNITVKEYPYKLCWNMTEGDHRFSFTAVDKNGKTRRSDNIGIKVLP